MNTPYCPRGPGKTAAGSLAAWWHGGGFRPRFHHGGSTLTQQLVRSYFLEARSSHEDGDVLFHHRLAPRLLSVVLGVPATNKLLRKLDEVRTALWLEKEMEQRYGSREKAKREIFARYASFLYLGNGRYGFAAGSDYYFGKPLSSYKLADAGKAALLAGINKSPRDYAPVPGDPRPLRRRNEILALMVRNGYIPEVIAKRGQAEPIGCGAAPAQDRAPAAIESVFAELRQHGVGRFEIQDLFEGRIAVRSSVHGGPDHRERSSENGLALYTSAAAEGEGADPGLGCRAANADAAILAEAGGRQVYNDRDHAVLRLQPRQGLFAAAARRGAPMVYLTVFPAGLRLDTTVPDEPIAVDMGETLG